MNLLLIANAGVCVCALIGYLCGIHRYFGKGKVLYLKLIVSGVGCLMFARLFPVIFILTQGDIKPGFNVGLLGLAGSFMFLLSANYGGMDSLVDDGSRTHLLSRIVSLLAPLSIIGLYAIVFIEVDMLSIRLGCGIVTFFMIPCIYYNLKHAIIRDEDLGMVRPLRLYNILAVVYALAVGLEFVGEYMELIPLYIAAMALQGLLALIMVPVAGSGVAKWTI